MTGDDLIVLLERYPQRLRPLGRLRFLEGSGGLSGSRLWRYSSSIGEMLIRAWPGTGQDFARIAKIHDWLHSAADLAIVPQPLPAIDGRTVQELGGRCWEIVPWLSGEPETHRPPRITRVRAAFEALALFHLRLSGHQILGPSPGINVRRGELTRLSQNGFDTIERKIAAQADDPCAGPALDWLALARRHSPEVLATVESVRRLSLPLQPCIRDARPEHFLFDLDAVSGLIDFGAMDVETVAGDLARLMGEWLPIPECGSLRAAGLAAYQRLRPLNPDEVSLMSAFEAVADILIAERWIRWRFQEGRRFDDPQAHARGITRGLERLRTLARRLG